MVEIDIKASNGNQLKLEGEEAIVFSVGDGNVRSFIDVSNPETFLKVFASIGKILYDLYDGEGGFVNNGETTA